ncbi:aldehyde dehydrogenase family protein [Halovivax limisalsi]|uniref:2,5-dioxovalerate dehydrogenase n=1 Tax=Halovivax limisalsi TaxID=1453760 RepID=UPI001FFD9E85|nr:aldehyde dehydrogenase family protein [Halovivax limisalsi]
MPTTFQNYVDGEWVDSETGETFETANPAAPDEVVGRFQQSSAADADRAVEAAATAADEWADTPGPKRGRILERTARALRDRREELTETLVREEGKAEPEAAGEVQRAIDIFGYYAGKARDIGGTVSGSSSPDRRLYTVEEPIGVAALITPWNYPIAIPAWKIAPALAAGATAVFKPATLAPAVSAAIVEELDEAGLPDGALNYVTGPGSEVGDALATHSDVDAVSFTGSTMVGESLREAAAPDGKRIQLEMGGKNPVVVSEHADLETAVDVVAGGAFGVTGQACTATSRAIVHESRYDEFVDRLVERAESIEIGPGLDGYRMGPQVSESERDGTLDYVDAGTREGATLETGGGVPEGDRFADGHFVEPTVFSDVDSEMRIAQEEIFGPVVAAIPTSGFDEALEIANDVRYGLSAGIVTDDLTEANRFVDEIEAGVVKVNERTTGVELHVPFGGLKASSSETFREQGEAGLDFFTISKTAYVNY